MKKENKTKYYKGFYEINEEFEFHAREPLGKVILKVQKSFEFCSKCFFSTEKGCKRPHLLPSCLAMMRRDDKPIQYVFIKKV